MPRGPRPPLAPGNPVPGAFVQVVKANLRHDFNDGDARRYLRPSGEHPAEGEGADRAGGPPADRLGQAAPVQVGRAAAPLGWSSAHAGGHGLHYLAPRIRREVLDETDRSRLVREPVD